MPKAISGLIGAVNFSDVRAYDTTLPLNGALFPQGTTVTLDDGGTAVYIRALSELSTYAAVGFNSDFNAQMLTTTLASIYKGFAAAQVSIPSGYFGWVQRGGKFIVNAAASCAIYAQLYTTATAGVLDDATVSAGLIAGVQAMVSISNATAITAFGSNPHILSIGGL